MSNAEDALKIANLIDECNLNQGTYILAGRKVRVYADYFQFIDGPNGDSPSAFYAR